MQVLWKKYFAHKISTTENKRKVSCKKVPNKGVILIRLELTCQAVTNCVCI